ncbi:YolD-like family protein [Paenibacillus sp. FSL F4-0125]|uniref:YolD-like family protein n=1 Tax=Paenibacillus sp. FSL F4-0125 TaxID=2954730 RepID=UPI0030F78746
MIIPEHKQCILSDSRNEIRSELNLDPQALAEISQVLAQSMEDHSPITLTLFDQVKDKEIRGIVMRVDQKLQQIKLRTSDDGWEWVEMVDVIGAFT